MRVHRFGGLTSDRAMVLVALLFVFSLAFHALVLALGFHSTPEAAPNGYRPFYSMPNWAGYPAFFLLLAPALWLSWTPFVGAWRRLADTGVLQGAGDARTLDRVEAAIRGWRWVAWLLALLLTVGVNTADLMPAVASYAGDPAGQEALACTAPDAFGRWLFEGDQADATAAQCEAAGVRYWSGMPAPAGQVVFAAGAVLQQIGIVLLASLTFFQLLLHPLLFALFGRLEVGRAHGLHLALNAESPLNEFGLEHWNHALNNVYWALTPALVGALVSRQVAAATGVMHPGQELMNVLIPIAVLAPMIVTVIARQTLLPEAWSRLAPNGPADPARYLDQRLWPLDRNWSSKLGILLAIIFAGLVIGMELRHFTVL